MSNLLTSYPGFWNFAQGVLGFTNPTSGPYGFGIRVLRPTANLPQTTAHALYTIAGGRVALTLIVGEVTTVIQTQANNTKLISNPTVGADLDICAVLSTTALAVGTLLGITGLFSDALIGAGPGALSGPTRPVVLPVGTLDLSCAASNTGQVKWLVCYQPIDPGATLVAA